MKKLLTGLILAAFAFTLTAGIAQAADTPRQVYAKSHKAIMEGDFEKLTSLMVKEERKKMEKASDKEKKMGMAMLKMMLPKKYKVLSEKITGNTATLKLSGMAKGLDGKPSMSYGTVLLKKEEGRWKMAKEKWSSKSK